MYVSVFPFYTHTHARTQRTYTIRLSNTLIRNSALEYRVCRSMQEKNQFDAYNTEVFGRIYR